MALTTMMAGLAVSCGAAQTMDFDLLIPKPQQVAKLSGTCAVPEILGVANEFQDPRLDAQIVRTFPGRKVVPGQFLTIKKAPQAKGDEASELTISPAGIEIRAAAPAGAFYALKTLEQLGRSGSPLPCGTVNDWPALEFRGVHLLAGWQVDALKQVIEEMASLKYNKLVLEYETSLPWKHGSAEAYTIEESRALAKLAQDNFIEFIPLIDSLGHMQPYLWPEECVPLREQPESTADLCPQNPECKKFVKGLWDIALEPLPGEGFAHIAGDETFATKPCPKCQPFADQRGKLYRDYYTDLAAWMAKRGKRSILWGDMLLKNPEALEGFPRDVVICYWDYTGTDGDIFSPYMKHNMEGKCDSQRQELLGPYWKPNQRGLFDPFPYLQFFGDQGFKTIAASASVCSNNGDSWPCDLSPLGFFNNQRFALEAEKQSKTCLGLLDTTWFFPVPGIWFGIVPGGDFAWNPRPESFPDYVQRFASSVLRRPDWGKALLRLSDLQEGKATGEVPTLDGVPGPGASPMAQDFARLLNFTADYMRLVLARRVADGQAFRAGVPGTPVPLDLAPAANCVLKDALPPIASRITAAPGAHDLQSLPFQLDGQHVISLSSNTPGVAVSLPLGRKVSGLLFWDAGFNAWPDTVLSRMKVNYADGTHASFDFVGGTNLPDWSAVGKTPKDKAACVAAWRGRKDTSEPITTWLTYWRNPQPDKQVGSIELSALPSTHERQSRSVFLGITALEGMAAAPAAAPAPADNLDKLESWAKTNFLRWMKQGNVNYTCDVLFAPFRPAPAPSLEVGADRLDGVYKSGEKIVFSIHAANCPADAQFDYVVKFNTVETPHDWQGQGGRDGRGAGGATGLRRHRGKRRRFGFGRRGGRLAPGDPGPPPARRLPGLLAGAAGQAGGHPGQPQVCADPSPHGRRLQGLEPPMAGLRGLPPALQGPRRVRGGGRRPGRAGPRLPGAAAWGGPWQPPGRAVRPWGGDRRRRPAQTLRRRAARLPGHGHQRPWPPAPPAPGILPEGGGRRGEATWRILQERALGQGHHLPGGDVSAASPRPGRAAFPSRMGRQKPLRRWD